MPKLARLRGVLPGINPLDRRKTGTSIGYRKLKLHPGTKTGSRTQPKLMRVYYPEPNESGEVRHSRLDRRKKLHDYSRARRKKQA